MTVDAKPREISIQGLERLAIGAWGECFRLDHRLLVKLYSEGVDPAIAYQEKRCAEAAHALGIPTPQSFEIVACGNRSGVVFELLDAQLLSSYIIAAPGEMDRHVEILVGCMTLFHAVKGDPARLPSLKEHLIRHIRQSRSYLMPEETGLLMQKLESIPDAENCVHFDLHSSNIMIRGGQPVIIDMGDVSIGNYLFDIGLMYLIYGFPELGFCEMVTGIPVEQGLELWRRFEFGYFAGKTSDELRFFRANRHFLASLRMIYTINCLPKMRAPFIPILKEKFIPAIMASA